MYRLLCLDMDGVVFTTRNFWLDLHKAFGTLEEGTLLTERYLHSDYERLVDEVVGRLWKGKDATPYYRLIEALTYMPGVEQLFAWVREQGLVVAVISSSSIDAARRAQRDYGIDHIYANQLVIRNGKVTGDFVWPIGAGREHKTRILKDLCQDLGFTPADAIYIGDSDTDVDAAACAGLSISFNGSDALNDAADHSVTSGTLSDVVALLRNS